MTVVALLGCGPGDDEPGGYVLLDPDAAEAGWSIEVGRGPVHGSGRSCPIRSAARGEPTASSSAANGASSR
jgi:hypothetical protein